MKLAIGNCQLTIDNYGGRSRGRDRSASRRKSFAGCHASTPLSMTVRSHPERSRRVNKAIAGRFLQRCTMLFALPPFDKLRASLLLSSALAKLKFCTPLLPRIPCAPGAESAFGARRPDSKL